MQSSTFQDPGMSAAVAICCEPLGYVAPGAAASNANGSGFLGGVQAGVNYQVRKLVIGAELDWSGTKLNGTSVGVEPATGGFPATETFGVRTNWTATATATAGIAFDRWLVYGKTGLALAEDSYSLGFSGKNYCFGGGCTGLPFGFASTASGVRTGWTVGTGVAWAYDANWSVKVEYDYLGFGNSPVDFSGAIQNAKSSGPYGPFGPLTGTSTFNTNSSQHISEVKIGLNYKIGPAFLLDPADPVTPRYAKAAPMVTAVNWSGFHVGGHVGGGWQETEFQDPSGTAALIECCSMIGALTPGAAAPSATGGAFLGGVQAGWNYQIKRLVTGIDVDWSATRLSSTNTAIYQGSGTVTGANVAESFGMRTDWTATATAKVGLAYDRWLAYAKGGVALAHENDSLNLSGPNTQYAAVEGGNFAFTATSGETRIGWTVGTGLAWAYDDHWSAKIEYDYLDFASKAVDFGGVFQNALRGGYGPMTSSATLNTNNTQHVSELKLGIDYRFAPGAF